jgi:peptide/nickel transport system substrate-binding protein
MSRIDRFAATILIVALIVVAGAMAAPKSDRGGPSASSATTSSLYREGVIGRPSSITPLTARTQVDRDLVSLLFRGLVKEGPDGSLEPDLASSWSVAANGKSYTFVLRTALWEDGIDVTADDVVFTLGLIQSSEYQGSLGATWYGIKAVAESRYVVRFDLPTPLGGFLRQACLPLLPDHLLHDVAASELADSDYAHQPVGDGAFQLLELSQSHAILQRAESDAGASVSTAPASAASASASPSDSPSPVPTADAAPTRSVFGFEMRFFDDPATMAAEFKAGHLDAVGGLAPDLTAAAASRADARILLYPWAMMTGVVLNQRATHPELRDANVRSALLRAIDRQGLVEDVFGEGGMVADAPFPAWSQYYDSASVRRVPYDLSAARTRLTAAAWTESSAGWVPPKHEGDYSIKLLAPQESVNPMLYRAAVAVVSDWRAFNIDAELEAVPAGDYMSRLRSGDFTAAVAEFALGLDPDLTPVLSSGQSKVGGANISGYQDSSLDRLLATVRTTTDPNTRMKAVSAVEKHLDSTVPILPLAFRDYQFVVSSRVRDLAPNHLADPSGRYWDVIDWRLASGG